VQTCPRDGFHILKIDSRTSRPHFLLGYLSFPFSFRLLIPYSILLSHPSSSSFIPFPSLTPTTYLLIPNHDPHPLSLSSPFPTPDPTHHNPPQCRCISNIDPLSSGNPSVSHSQPLLLFPSLLVFARNVRFGVHCGKWNSVPVFGFFPRNFSPHGCVIIPVVLPQSQNPLTITLFFIVVRRRSSVPSASFSSVRNRFFYSYLMTYQSMLLNPHISYSRLLNTIFNPRRVHHLPRFILTWREGLSWCL